MASWYAIRARAGAAEVAIYDEIGAYGVSAKGFLAEPGALPVGTPIDLRLNSPGGSVFDAVAIHNAIKRHQGAVTVWIDGIAASAASYVAMAGDEIVMPENAFLMIHDPVGLVAGSAEDMRAMAGALDKVKASLVQGCTAKSGRTAEEVSALMSAETWFDAAEALAHGFADRLVAPQRIAARFDIARFRNAPPALAAVVGAESENGASDVVDVRAEEGADANSENPAEGGNGASDPAGYEGGTGPAVTAAAETETDASVASSAAETEGGDENPAASTPDELGGDNGDPAATVPAPDAKADDRAPAEIPPAPDAATAPPDAATIRATAMAHARAVLDLCRLAGQPQMAGRFLETDAGLDEVRAALLAARAATEPEIAAHHPQPGRQSAARPWGEIVARTFRLKG